MEARKLCLKLAGADTEEEIISILKELSYWDNTECWKIFNNESNNFDRIGNQQSSPDAALVEKLINSIDSMLIKEIPDVITTGDMHKSDIEKYNGVLIISNSCWQTQTAFEEKVGNQPDLCKVPVLNLKTGQIKILDFE